MDSSSARLLICSSEGGAAVELSILPSTSTSCSTGLVYDSRVCAHANPEGDHPEHPERVTSLWSAVRDGGLASHCVSVPARLATRAEVELVHEVQHWDRIEWAVGQELNAITAFAARHESLYLNSASLDAACCAAGGVLELTTKVVMGRSNGMALVARQASRWGARRHGLQRVRPWPWPRSALGQAGLPARADRGLGRAPRQRHTAHL